MGLERPGSLGGRIGFLLKAGVMSHWNCVEYCILVHKGSTTSVYGVCRRAIVQVPENPVPNLRMSLVVRRESPLWLLGYRTFAEQSFPARVELQCWNPFGRKIFDSFTNPIDAAFVVIRIRVWS